MTHRIPGRLGKRIAPAFALCAVATLAACGTDSAPTRPDGPTGVARLEPLLASAKSCWFDTRDPAFADLVLAPELGSPSGRPRFLLVPRSDPTERPRLVVQGFEGSSEVMVYGPLLGEDAGRRIEADLSRWKAGTLTCTAAA